MAIERGAAAFLPELLRSGHAAFGQDLLPRTAFPNTSDGWISAGPLSDNDA